MSIVCTLKCDHLALPKLNLRKPAAARNVLLAKGTSKSICNNRSTPAPTNAAPVARMTATSFERSRLLGATGGAVADELKQQKLRRYKNQEQQGIMVAEFVERQHSSGSPVNGETPSQGHSLSDMPDTTVTIGSKNHPSAAGKANNIQQQQQAPQQQLHHPGRMDCLSPELSLGGKSNGPLVGHTCTHGSSMLHQEPPSPQSSEGDHSISEHVHHLNNSSSSSSSGKYGSGSASPNGSSGGGYDVQHMSKAQQQQQVKELFTQRKQREFIPDNKKDDSYWDRRRRNNEAAKRSREKRRYNDMVLEQRVVELTKENHVLKAQLDAIRDKFNISGENLVSVEQIMASLPTSEQVLSITKRAKIGVGAGAGAGAAPASVGMGPSIVYAGAVAPQPEQSSSLQAPPLKHQPATQGKGAKLGAHLSGLSHLQPGGSHSVQHFVQQASPPQLHPYGGGQLLSPTVSTTTGSPALSTSPLHLEEPHPHPQAGPHIQPQLQHQHQPHLQQHQQQQHSASLLHSPIPLYSSQIQGLPQVHHRHHLQVLKAFNRNVGVSGDDIDNLRKVVAVVGAMTAGSAPGCGGDDVPNSGLYRPVTPSRSPPHSTIYAHGQSPGLRSHPYKYTSVITSKDHTPTSSASSSNHGQGHAHAGHHLPLSHCQRAALLTPPSAVDAVVSSSMALLSSGSSGSPSVSEGSPLYSDPCAEVAASVLNLSHRASSPNYELLLSSSSLLANSSSHSSSVCSGDDEHEPDALYDAASIATTTTEAGGAASTGSTENPGTNPNSCSVISSSGNGGAGGGGNNDSNNSLPLKLRHKSHLGDKDAAANALLALQHIKQEPISSRLSPRSWTTNDGDNSSDERDSGISIVSEDWTARFQRAKLVLPEASSLLGDDGGDVDNLRAVTVTASERDHILKSQLARLESEVANIKNMMIMTTTTGTGLAPSTASASGFATTAQ